MRSAQLNHSPSGVDGPDGTTNGCGCVERLGAEVEGARETSEPQGVSNPRRGTGTGRPRWRAPGPVAAVVTEGDGLGQGHVEPAARRCPWPPGPPPGRGSGGCAGGRREHEDLGLAGQAAERRGVEDPVRSRSKQVRQRSGSSGRWRFPAPVPRVAAGPALGVDGFPGLALQARVQAGPSGPGGCRLGEGDSRPAVAGHGRGPAALRSFLASCGGGLRPLAIAPGRPGLSYSSQRASVHMGATDGCDGGASRTVYGRKDRTSR